MTDDEDANALAPLPLRNGRRVTGHFWPVFHQGHDFRKVLQIQIGHIYVLPDIGRHSGEAKVSAIAFNQKSINKRCFYGLYMMQQVEKAKIKRRETKRVSLQQSPNTHDESTGTAM